MSKQTRNISQKTFGERIFHAVGFETIAVLISAPAAAWALNKPVWEMGALAIMLSTTAMVWNIIYNSLFDKFWPVSRVVRTFKIRVAHALGFEGGFILIGLPVAALWLGISLPDAFMLEMGFFLFFLPYTVAYNWVYDTLRHHWMNRRMAAKDCPAKH